MKYKNGKSDTKRNKTDERRREKEEIRAKRDRGTGARPCNREKNGRNERETASPEEKKTRAKDAFAL